MSTGRRRVASWTVIEEATNEVIRLHIDICRNNRYVSPVAIAALTRTIEDVCGVIPRSNYADCEMLSYTLLLKWLNEQNEKCLDFTHLSPKQNLEWKDFSRRIQRQITSTVSEMIDPRCVSAVNAFRHHIGLLLRTIETA